MSARVLVVDDVPANVKLLEARLSAEYFDVITASSGPQALEIARVLFPERDFSGVKSVRVGTANGVTLYELLNERGAGVAKVLSKGLSIARCLR